MMMDDSTLWRFYDFDIHWGEFYKVWSSDAVQDILAPSMVRWCEHEAYFVRDSSKLRWKGGADLWRYSRTDFHHERIMNATIAHVDQHRLIQRFGDALTRAGTPHVSGEVALVYRFVSSGAFETVKQQFLPPPGSLEAQVLVKGANYLVDAQAAAVLDLFPDSRVCVIGDEDQLEVAVVENHHLIVDFTRFFMWKHASGPSACELMTGIPAL